VFVGLVTAWLCLGPASVSAAGEQGRPCSKALHGDSMVQLSAGDSRCTCLAGYQLVADNADNSIGGDTTWWCEACAAGFFKATQGLQACTPCETKNMWSAAGQTACVACGASSMVTTQTLHTVCVPCPSEMSTLVRYIDNQQLTNKAMPFPGPDSVSPDRLVTLFAGNMAEFRAVYVVNSDACLSPSDVVASVETMLTLRTVCQRGTHMRTAASGTRDDVDTECVPCGPATYNDEIGASACKAVTPCTDGRYVDATGRDKDSTCTLDWSEVQILLGNYPILPASAEAYEFDAHRPVGIFGYTACKQPTSSADQQRLSTKCGGAGHGLCVHDFTGSWQRGVVVLANVVALCQYRCRPGYHLWLGQCLQCAAGTHKHEGMPEDAACVLCDAGKHRSDSDLQAGTNVCSACGHGKFATTTRTTCEDVCTANRAYPGGHVCFRATPSYIIALPPGQQTLRVNVEPCPAATGTTAVVDAVTVVTYSNEGVLSCEAHAQCGSAYRSVAGACEACPAVGSAQNGVFLHQCMPSCNPQHHPVRKNAVVPPLYTCERCGHDTATFVLQKCAFADYLADTCSEHNKNTPCLPCSALQQQHQIHDIASVQINAFDRHGRCKFKCRGVQMVQNKNWYFVDVGTAADMLGMQQQALRTRLANNIDGGAQVGAFFLNFKSVC